MIVALAQRGSQTTYSKYLGATALIALLCGELYRRFFRVPKQLQHIPSISYWRFLFSLFIKKESLTSRTQRLVFPLLSQANGLYLNKFPFDWTVYVTDPILVKTVLFKPGFPKTVELMDNFPESSPIYQFSGKDNVAIVNGEQWKRQRKIMNPAFHRIMPVALFGNIVPKAFKIIDQAEGAPVAVASLMQRLTLEMLGKASFAFAFGALDDENSVWLRTYRDALDGFLDMLVFFPKLDSIWQLLYPPRKRRYNAAFKIIKLLDDMINSRRAELRDPALSKTDNGLPEHEKDLLTLMLEAELRGEGSLTHDELRHNIAVFFMAGHDTTSNALSFCLYHLAVNKDIQQKARDEIISLLSDDPIDIIPTVEQCKKMSYLDMVIKENLRIFPPGNDLMARTVQEDMNLGGIMIPQGTLVSVDIHALHHRPDIWPDPERFDPERFRDNNSGERHEGIVWVPFSGGSRQCIGMNFSLFEQRVVLSMLLRKYEWDLPVDCPHRDGLKFDFPLNLAPRSLKVQFRPRY